MHSDRLVFILSIRTQQPFNLVRNRIIEVSENKQIFNKFSNKLDLYEVLLHDVANNKTTKLNDTFPIRPQTKLSVKIMIQKREYQFF